MVASPGGISVNYGGVDQHTGTLGSIMADTQSNIDTLNSLNNQLAQMFSGVAASVAQPLVNKFHLQLQEYKDAVTRLNSVISATSGTGGTFHGADVSSSTLFNIS
jgi:uncharacterized protein YukE